MKKLRWLILVVAAMMGLALFAACTPSEPQTTTYTVTYYDGSNVLKTESVEEGGKATNWTPQKEGYNFEGWWATPGFTHEFKFEEVTINAETLVVLSHKKPDSHLEVKIDFDNTSLDKTAIAERAEKRKPQEKTTYKKIQEWIEENYGFKVHTAYVAEVKRELGLPMYDAPNAVDELKHPRQHPTEQMTTAIKAALKHFEII